MIKEHAILYNKDLTPEKLSYLIDKANKLGLLNRKIHSVSQETDSEGKHIFFECDDMESKNTCH